MSLINNSQMIFDNILNVEHFMHKTKRLKPLYCLQIVISILSCYLALCHSPADYQQGELVRIMYVHVPSAWLALLLYGLVTALSTINLIWRNQLAFLLAVSTASVGCCFAAITLITGSIWGRPTWGTWWVWDPRLTSMLVLFLLYVTYLILVYSGENLRRIQNPAGVVAILGFINVPIVKFSVVLWASLHQPPSISLMSTKLHQAMLVPLITMTITMFSYALLMIIARTRRLVIAWRAELDYASR